MCGRLSSRVVGRFFSPQRTASSNAPRILGRTFSNSRQKSASARRLSFEIIGNSSRMQRSSRSLRVAISSIPFKMTGRTAEKFFFHRRCKASASQNRPLLPSDKGHRSTKRVTRSGYPAQQSKNLTLRYRGPVPPVAANATAARQNQSGVTFAIPFSVGYECDSHHTNSANELFLIKEWQLYESEIQ
jgi:hypothetical protein